MTETEDQRGVYEFTDGGKYIGEWKDELANGHGVCTGPSDGGTFEGEWHQGSQLNGVFSCNGQRYSGAWQNGMRHGLGKEVRSDGAEYIGEFTDNCRGMYGVLKLPNEAIYQGTWNNGLQDGVGMELYADKGVYKGQYKRGLRHGFGTRSSAMYEVSSKKKVSKSPHTTERIDEDRSVVASVRRSESQSLKVRPKKLYQQHSSSSSMLPGMEHAPTSSLVHVQSRSQSTAIPPTTDSVNQIYEGQWENDRRQGYGVLKVPGRFTYCGEWLNNAKTGHGVMFYTDGRREEGYWTNGRLVTQLKHKKLSLKHHQLESKVNQAHTQALQAADTARTKAILAESRASGASSRAKMAEKVIVAAEVSAEKARSVVASINSLEKTKTRISTGKTPLVEMNSFPSLDADTTKSLCDTSSSGSLFVPHIPSSASFENLLETDEEEPPADKLSLSTGCLDKKRWDNAQLHALQNIQDVQSSNSSLSSSHSHDDGLPAIQVNATDSPTTNRKSKTLPPSSRRHLTKQDSMQLSSPETTEERLPTKEMEELEDLPLEIKIPKWQNASSMRRRKRKSIPLVNNSTGEVITVSADGSEDEQGTPTKPTPKMPIPAVTDAPATATAQVCQQMVAMDILQQMAQRNKTMEAINMFLMVCIILLLALIIGVFTVTLGINRPSGLMGPML